MWPFNFSVIIEQNTFSLTQTQLLLLCCPPCVWQWSGGSRGGGGCVSRWLSEVHFLIKAAGPPTEPQRFEWRNAEATHAAHFTGWYCCTIDLTTRRCSRPTDWIYCANMVSMLSFTHHCQLPSCIPCLFLSSSICNRFLWLMVKRWLILTHLSMF